MGTYIEHFIERENLWNQLMERPEITFPLSQEVCMRLRASIESQLSPENLFCDGERSSQDAQADYNYLTHVAKELDAIDSKKTDY